MDRRKFIYQSAAIIAAAGTNAPLSWAVTKKKGQTDSMRPGKTIRIDQVNCNFERESLLAPFGFKGGYLSELWQTVACMKSDQGNYGVGLGTQSVLWSDAELFSSNSESGGNTYMYAMSERALQMIKGESFSHPVTLLEELWEEVYKYGQKITGNKHLRKTFALNALVAVDNAAWLLYAKENGFNSFDQLIPAAYQQALGEHHEKIAGIPLVSYNVSLDAIKGIANAGYFFIKIKIGQPGTQNEMLEKDKQRLSDIHKTIGHFETPHTLSGKILYYLDANGRYEKKETLLALLDHARNIGAIDQIVLLEEPFPEEVKTDVSQIGVRMVSDETAHTDKDALERIQMGYGAIALKPIAKTLSMSMKVAEVAHQNNIPCFCADLTVNPILVEWNKAVAARINAFPGLQPGVGLCESNGAQNYTRWEEMCQWSPCNQASWKILDRGIYHLNDEYYSLSGGIFQESEHYNKLVISSKKS